jgi:catechol 2,3-dioxygenase-like lactoylglutathione lyase family enzyme
LTNFREAFPILYVDDVATAARFYVENLGFEQVYRFPPEGTPDFAFLKLEPLGIAVSQRRPEHEGRELELCIYTDDVDAAAEQLRAAGAAEVEPPTDREWGERMAYFRDPDGHLLHVTAKL